MTKHFFTRWPWGLIATLTAATVSAQPAPTPAAAPLIPAQRIEALTHMVRQDCGSCHGMRLTGGLGPALTAEALAAKPPEYLQAVILHGIPGTPMPPWGAMLTAPEAQWIAQQLFQGFPLEKLEK